MKLSEHVDKIRNIIEKAFDKELARLGIGKNKIIDIDKISPEYHKKREHLEQMLESHIGETGSFQNAREKLIDEFTFTLFNRLAAIKVMEAVKLFPPIITKQAEYGDRSLGHSAWLELNPYMKDEEFDGLRDYIKYAFDELGETLPLYSEDFPYAMLPDVISLNEIINAFNELEKDPQVGADIWQNDDILGWLYESYNNKKKQEHKDSGKKTEYNKVSLQSQVYTPRWVVKFLVDNSLGKLYLEMFPDSEIKEKYKIANAPESTIIEPKKLSEVKIIDPACGSGNFILYAFELFYDLYLDQINNYNADYSEDEIPKLIIENNLHGIDIDDRAVQLAQLGLYIKARKKNRKIGKLNFKIVSSDFFLPDYEDVRDIFEVESQENGFRLIGEYKEWIKEIWVDLKDAHKFGSLLKIDKKFIDKLNEFEKEEKGIFTQNNKIGLKESQKYIFENLKQAVKKYATTATNTFLTTKTHDAITFVELLINSYDVAVTNPPYTDSSDYGAELKKFIEANYKKPYKFHTNLYAVFIKRNIELTNENGFIGMIHPHTFMFIKSFEDVRKYMIEHTHIELMVDYGLDRVNLFGPGILLDATWYVLNKKKQKTNGIYFQITGGQQEKTKKESLEQAYYDMINKQSNPRVFFLTQEKLKIIGGWPFIYWISGGFREKFRKNSVSKISDIRAGIQTSNNNRFLRHWWEVKEDDIFKNKKVVDSKENRWVIYSKGGPFNKWYGNLWVIIDWLEDGNYLKQYLNSIGQDLHAQEYYFMHGITYSASGSKGISFRELPENTLFDIGGSSIFLNSDSTTNSYLMGLLNSKITLYITNCLNPTVNVQPQDLKRIPFVQPPKDIETKITSLAKENIAIKKHLCEYSIIEINFKQTPLTAFEGNTLKERLLTYLNYENYQLTKVLINEAIIDKLIYQVYELSQEDRDQVEAKLGKSIGSLPVTQEALEHFINKIKDESSETKEIILEHLQSLKTTEFDPEEIQEIKNGFSTLYQKNNNLEEFCKRFKINPINVWYWFKNEKILPSSRAKDIALEFLADMIREILTEDDDGIIPLVPNAGEKILIRRIEEKFIEKGFSMAQYSSFDSLIGKPLEDYINKYFFQDLSNHLNLFMYLPKTPFIWHLSSGQYRGFECFILIYKWSRDKLMRLRSVYIEYRERALINRQSDLADNNSAVAQNEKDFIFKQLKEIEDFKAKIDDLLAEGYNPVLDDGVGKNIAPLQKRGMLTYDVLNKKQLEKYLNADW